MSLMTTGVCQTFAGKLPSSIKQVRSLSQHNLSSVFLFVTHRQPCKVVLALSPAIHLCALPEQKVPRQLSIGVLRWLPAEEEVSPASV